MELQKSTLRYQRQIARQTAYREEDAECVVPDSLPDIARIVDASGTALIRDWTPGEGEVTIRCAVRAVVLYAAEEDRKLYRMEVPLSFTHRMELRGAEPDCGLLCSCFLLSADAHAVNPRKVSVRVSTALTPRLYARTEESFTTGVHDAEGCCVRKQKLSFAAVTAVSSRNFTLVEDIEVPENEGTVRTVLRSDLQIRPAEVRIMANRVTVKASAEVTALCENTEGRIFRLTGGFGFTQTAEVTGAAEGQRAAVDFCLRSLDLDPALDMAGNARCLSLSAGAVMNVELSGREEMELVTDLYGTRRGAELTRREVALADAAEELRFSARAAEHIETPVPVRRVVDRRILADEAAESLPGEECASLGVMIALLCEGEDGGWYELVRRVALRVDADGALPARVRAEIRSFEVTASAGGLDVAVEASVGAGEERTARVSMVEDVSWGEPFPPDGCSRMSALIRRVSGRESLWEIAREYHTSAEAVALANRMTAETVPDSGTLLLIPMKK